MISLDKARELLGETGKNMTDEEIIVLERNIQVFVNIALDRAIEDIKNRKKDFYA